MVSSIVAKYRKKPVVVEALRWTGKNFEAMSNFYGAFTCTTISAIFPKSTMLVLTLEGTMRAKPGAWIIKGVKGEFYPCKSDIFEETYEKAEAE